MWPSVAVTTMEIGMLTCIDTARVIRDGQRSRVYIIGKKLVNSEEKRFALISGEPNDLWNETNRMSKVQFSKRFDLNCIVFDTTYKDRFG
jgi:hypothetical protein